MQIRVLASSAVGIFLCSGLVACSATSDGAGAGGAATGGAGVGGTGGVGTGGAGTGGTAGVATGGSGGGATGGTGGGTGTFDCSSATVCDDFEAGTDGALPAGYTAQLDYGNNGDASRVAVTSEQAHSGTKSVKVDGTTGLFGLVREGAGETYHLRVWLKIEDLTNGNPTIVGAGADPNSEMRMRLFKSGASPHYVTANAASGDGLSPPNSSGSGACPECVAVPTDWFCLRMSVDNTTDSLAIYVGDEQAVNLVNNAPWHNPSTWPASVDRVRIGATELNGAGATVYIDDLAIDDAPIACQ